MDTIATACSDIILAEHLQRVAELNVRQRDPIKPVIIDVLIRPAGATDRHPFRTRAGPSTCLQPGRART